MLSKILSGVMLSVGLFAADFAEASSYPTFTLDLDKSSISATTSACISNCGVTAEFTQSGETSFTFANNWNQVVLSDIIRWSFDNDSTWSSGLYDIAANLVFTSPDTQETSNGGSGLLTTFYGIVSSGILIWTSAVQHVVFDQGSELLVRLEGGLNFGFGPAVETDITLTAYDLAPMDAPSPAPVPPALPLMLLALGGMVYIGRRQNAPNRSA